MLPILLTALMLIGVMGGCPHTPIGRSFRGWLVEAPARILSRLSLQRLMGAALLAGIGLVLFLLLEVEGLRLFAMAAPELIAWAVMFDLTVALDVVAAGLTLAAVARLRPMIALVQRAVARFAALPRRAGRARRSGTIRRSGPRRSDDPEPFASYAFA